MGSTTKETYSLIFNLELLLSVLTGFANKAMKVTINDDTVTLYEITHNVTLEYTDSWTQLFFTARDLKTALQQLFIKFFDNAENIKEMYKHIWAIFNSSTQSFYEDKIFKLFTMLDLIVGERIKTEKIKFHKKEKMEIRKVLQEKIDALRSGIIQRDGALSIEIYDAIKENILKECFQGNRKSYLFKVKQLYTEYLSDDAKKIIDFDDNLFKLLEVSRNDIAHANKLKEEFYQKAHILYYKTLFFVCYLIWNEIGLNDELIFKSIGVHNNLRSFCNEKELDIFTGSLCITLTQEEERYLFELPHSETRDGKAIFSNIIIICNAGEYSLDKTQTKAFINIKHNALNDYNKYTKNLRDTFKAEFLKFIWMESESGLYKINDVFIIRNDISSTV